MRRIALRITLIILILIWTSSITVFAKADKEKIEIMENQIIDLNQKIEYLEKHNTEIVENAKWIFGLSVTVTIFVLGSFTFFSVKITDRDTRIIKEELKLENSKRILELEDKIRKSEEHLNILLIEEIKKIEEQNNKNIEAKIESRVIGINNKVKILTIDFLEEKMITNNRLSMFICRKIVENATGVFDREYIIPDILKKIEKEISEGVELDSFDEEELTFLLQLVPVRFEYQKKRIEQRLKGM